MDKKVCSKCNQTLPIDNFYFKNKSKAHRRPSCKECGKKYYKDNKEQKKAYNKDYWASNKEKLAEQKKTYYEANKEKLAEQKKAYYEANKEKFKKWHKAYSEANKDKVLERRRAYYEANKDKLLERGRAYREANKEKLTERKKAYCEANKEKLAEQGKAYREANRGKIAKKWNAYKKQRAKKDPLFRIKNNYSGSCRRAFNSINQQKNVNSLKLLGLKTWQELAEHLEPQFYDHPKTGEKMTFDNHGFHGWHIDHIIPLSSAKTEEEIIKLCHYTNLQPLWAEENLAKSNKILDTE